ncbi:MAG TPA: hypothetical protein PK855_05670, partial [Bacteroidales bacterium]|nr:hypothetical protein [Bacteroidales bacterium]
MNTQIFNGEIFLITGIADANSLAMYVAKEIIANGGKVICTGLGLSSFHKGLSEKAQVFLQRSYSDFQLAVQQELGHTPTAILDVSLDESMEAFALGLSEQGIKLNGLLHAIA